MNNFDSLLLYRVAVVALICSGAVLCQTGTNVDDLLTTLFTTYKYNKWVRPVMEQSRPVKVVMDFYITSVIEFNEQAESLKTSGYLSLNWTDEYLTWFSYQENNTYVLFVPQDVVWKPDITLRNSFVSFTGLGASYLNVLISEFGEVEWMPNQVFQSTCNVDITYFPFDYQTCELKFSAWSYWKLEVELTKGSKGITLDEYEENSHWELIETSARNSDGNEPAVTFSLTLRRRPKFYVLNVILPVILLSILSVTAFLLPVSSGERAGYAITGFLSLAVFLTIIADQLPKNSQQTSLLAVYLVIMSCFSTLIVMVSNAQVRLAARDEKKKPVSKLFRSLVQIADKISCNAPSRRSVFPADLTSSKASLKSVPEIPEEEITWIEVVDAMDVVFFWFSLIFILICTVSIASVLTQ